MAIAPPPSPAALHDIQNPEGFVRDTLRRSRIRFDPDQREELVAEGLAILVKLANEYDHHRTGYAQAGSFAGYASVYLPKRLTDAWHKLNEHHSYVTCPDTGARSWDYGRAALSLQGLCEQDPDRADRLVSEARPASAGGGGFDNLKRALLDDFDLELELLLRVAIMRADGLALSAIATETGLSLQEIRAVDTRLGRALERLAA